MKTLTWTFSLILLVLLAVVGCGPEPTPGPTPGPNTPSSVQVGTPALPGMSYQWACVPAAAISDSKSAMPFVAPTKTTVCTVTVTSKCGIAKSSTTIRAFKVVDGQLVEQK